MTVKVTKVQITYLASHTENLHQQYGIFALHVAK